LRGLHGSHPPPYGHAPATDAFIEASGSDAVLTDIIDRFLAMATGDRGDVIAEVRSALPLSDAQTTQLTASLTKKFGSFFFAI
jgi:hypothetical protein